MKIKSLLVSVLFVSLGALSCSSDDSSSTTEIITEETSTSNTWVKLTAVTLDGSEKANYTVMMFEQPVSSTAALPPIKKQVMTDANGLAYFDLNSMITSTTPTTYYFEAFVETPEGFVWKSITHPELDLKKGSMTTTSIIVE